MTRLPTPENRTTIIGKTGSGKTVFGLWLLSTCCTLDWRNNPVTIFDFKGDKNIRKIEELGGAKEVSIRGNPPSKPGLYVVRPLPHELAEVDAYLWKVWRQEQHGLFFDEGLMVAKSKAIVSILTQGRSKEIPVIMLLQRPVWAPKWCFSEAQFFAIFRLQTKEDRDTARSYIDIDMSMRRLPYHALWYDDDAKAGEGEAVIFEPVPSVPEIVNSFAPVKRRAEKRFV